MTKWRMQIIVKKRLNERTNERHYTYLINESPLKISTKYLTPCLVIVRQSQAQWHIRAVIWEYIENFPKIKNNDMGCTILFFLSTTIKQKM